MWELDHKESWVLKNWCLWIVVLEKTLESPLDCKEIQPVHPKGDQSWVFIVKDWFWSCNYNNLATWCEKLTHLKRPWFWERLRAGGEGDNSRCDGWIVSLTQWTWIWVNSGSWWWTGRPGMLQFIGSQRVERESHWTELRLATALPTRAKLARGASWAAATEIWVLDEDTKFYVVDARPWSEARGMCKDVICQPRSLDQLLDIY